MGDRISALIGRLWADRKGVTALMTAVSATALMGFVGLGVDVVTWEMSERRMQGAADQAALAGAIAASGDYDVATAAKTVAASFGYLDGQDGVTVSVNSNYNNANEVKVAISQPEQRYFSRLVLASEPTISVSAVARPPGAPSNGSMCVMALEQSGQLAVGSADFIGNTNVQLDHCDLYNDSGDGNGTELSGSSALGVQNMYLAGAYTVGGSATLSVSGVSATYVMASGDPYSGQSIPSYSGCNQTNYSLGSNTSATLSPGVYCGGMNIKGTATLNAGTYVIDGGSFTVGAQGVVTGAGVTIILTSSSGNNYGTVTINGGASVSLTAPAVGATKGVPGIALWVDKNAPLATDTFDGGGSQIINGAIYLPSHEADYSGGSSTAVNNAHTTCSQLIALTVTFKGNSYFTHSGCSASNLPVKDPLAPPKLSS